MTTAVSKHEGKTRGRGHNTLRTARFFLIDGSVHVHVTAYATRVQNATREPCPIFLTVYVTATSARALTRAIPFAAWLESQR